ncbi:unnamed protein product [Linum trigynum]|uniref:Uncharacterized protein n=1 Tax=Linum trigynum TaxID=586398 RepID=A0AAV2DK19_9ROSI
MMEADFVTSGMFQEETVEIEDHNENSLLEGEKCGICMDFVIDRGVVDCCQHWFCFGCIDNWASITNLCPLCQNEFQLITCVPVYDTLGNNKVDEDTFSNRDDDWSIEGNSSTLSFPSYYIDENAVTCLDGDGCKIRSGSMSIEEDPNLDTSIACDSCDNWYHAFCVGFDVDGTCEDTWLCPRCTTADELPHKSDATSAPMPNDQRMETLDTSSLTDTGFSRKLSVDPGETAIVISMVGGNKWTELPGEEYSPIREVGLEYSPIREVGVEFNVNGVHSEAHLREEKITSENDGIKSVLEAPEPVLSLSSDMSTPGHLKTGQAEAAANSDDDPISGTKFFKSTVGCHLSFSLENSSVGISNSGTVDQVSSTIGKQTVPGDTSLRDEKVVPNAAVEAAKSIGVKRKQIKCSDDVSHSIINSVDPNDESAGAIPLKKFRGKGKSQKTQHSRELPEASSSDDLDKGSTEVAVTKDKKSMKRKGQGQAVTPDIMSIVQGTGRASKDHSAAGLRMKKIMRTNAKEDKDSSVIVQKLREEIKEAVRNGSAVNMGEKNLDPKLLAAFRAVITGPTAEPVVKKLAPSALKVKKSLLQKGKVRESLTKKIYADSNGRRRRAWDRDCEVEFWKYRCMRATKPEKVATLKSVLNLLRKTPGGEVVEEACKNKAESPILSRLYLADTSVFPRKNDIKPLSAHGGGTSDSEKGRTENNSSVPNGLKPSPTNKVPSKYVPLPQGLKNNNVDHSKNSPVAPSDGCRIKPKKETCVKVDDKKLDKRKWALEVLARKKAASASSRKEEEEDDKVMLKGNYQLLGQLPKDMRPALATIEKSKIPDSIRQTQLYRLTEFFLKKLNLPEICRTAETELAVADAINIEKEVAQKSTTKMVYVNLCSQQMLHRSSDNNVKAAQASESDTSAVVTDQQHYSNELPTDPAITEALRKAGLLSDSPPASPLGNSESPIEEEPDNILEIDTVPEADIYGDFEYDLDDEDFIGATTSMTVVPTKTVQEEAEAKMKVVFSTLKLEEPNNSQDSPIVVSGNNNGSHVPPPESLPGEEGNEEPSLAECEELYGPEKEPMMSRFQLEAPIENKPSLSDNTTSAPNAQQIPDEKNPSNDSHSTEEASRKDMQSDSDPKRQSEIVSSVSKKVEAYIKEHIRPLCKSGVISVEQYRWAVAKTTDKVMKYHSSSKNASFLIKEGEKVKKLAEQYAEAAQAQQKDSS